MEMTEIEREIAELEREIQRKQRELTQLRKQMPKQVVQDYLFLSSQNEEVRLSDLFGEKQELILIHNMGKGCSYCTLWADGFNGILPHLENKAAFVVSSPDPPEVQAAFARERGWHFRMISTMNTTFVADMGFLINNHHYPGVSIFQKEENGQIVRTAKDFFGPGDNYCSLWHLFDLLPSGSSGWKPNLKYPDNRKLPAVTYQVRVTDFEKGRAWYEKLLKRPPDFEPVDGFIEWELIPHSWLQVAKGTPAPGSGPLRIGVTDIEKERERIIRELDVEVSEIETLEGVASWCNFQDPFGNRLGLFQEL